MTWDDRLYVVHNEAIQGFSWQNIKTVFSSYYVGNYAPVQMVSYMLDYELWGMKAGGFHFTNIMLHALIGLLVYRLFLRCHSDRLMATIGAAVFLLHPVQVESVAWISQRKNLLAMLFFLLAWEGYCRYREANEGKGMPAYIASIASFVLALLAKSIVVIFPLVILLYDLCYPVKDQRIRLLNKAPYLLAAVIVAVLTIQSQTPIDDGFGGATGGGLTGYHGGSPFATFLTMLTVFCRYLWLLVWPVALSAAYKPTIYNSIGPAVIGSILLLTCVVISAVQLLKVNRKAGFWPFVFFISLLPVSQIIPLVTLMNDRYLYFPMLGVSALVGVGASFLCVRLRPWQTVPFYSLVTILLVLLSVISFQRAAIWQNDITFGRDTVAKCPTNYTAWEGLGEAYYFSVPPHNAEAVQAYSRALELAPLSKLTLFNLGVLYVEAGEYDKGYELLNKLLLNYYDHAAGWAYLGDIYLNKRNFKEADISYNKALSLKPDTLHAVLGLANLAFVQGQFNQARVFYYRAELISENDPLIAYSLAITEAQAGHSNAALLWVEKALQRGFNDYNDLLENKLLTVIRKDPRFNFLMQQCIPPHK